MPPEGELQFACSFGLETGGGGGAIIVFISSGGDDDSSSTRVVPSFVQKLSQPSSNV